MDLNDFSKIFPRSATTDNNGNLVLGGVGVNDLIENFGTPLYVICEETLLKQCNDFVDAFQKRHKDTLIAYASKAYLECPDWPHEGFGLRRWIPVRPRCGGWLFRTGLLPGRNVSAGILLAGGAWV